MASSGQAASPASPARPALSPAVPAIAGLLKLGQTSNGPPFKLIDLHVDHLGSTRVTTDEQGGVVTLHDFFPFGEEIVPMPDDSTKLFTGHERDRETGLDYMLARYYGPSLARFLTVDPGNKARGNPSTPQRWNLYAYARNNPVAFIDPNGREEITVTVTTRIPTATTSLGRLTFAGDAGGDTFRTRQTAKIETDPSKGGPLKSAKGEVGRTVMVTTLAGTPVVGASDPNRTPTTMTADATRGSDGSTTVTMSGNESNPLVPGSPGITYSMSLTVNSDGTTQLEGQHDGYPGYTVEVTREDGTTETIYTHDPEETGEGPGSLFPPAEHTVSQTGTLPKKEESK